MVMVFCGGWDDIGKTVLLVTFLAQLIGVGLKAVF